MQTELDNEGFKGKVFIVAVNDPTQSAGNTGYVVGRTLPLVQAIDAVNPWKTWSATWRDVFILDGKGSLVGSPFNLTENNLADPKRYSELKDRLRTAAKNL